MTEIGSFIGLAAMTQSEITIKDVQVPELGIIPRVFEKMGVQLEIKGDDIFIPYQEEYQMQTFIDGSIMTIYDAPWPGFTPDLMSIILVMATQAKGSLLVHQKMFESRLFFVDKLIDMGAQIILCDPHRATVIGLNRRFQLRGIEMTSPDIRAGVALLIAALSAKGTSLIHNISQIDRGYQRIDERLRDRSPDRKDLILCYFTILQSRSNPPCTTIGCSGCNRSISPPTLTPGYSQSTNFAGSLADDDQHGITYALQFLSKDQKTFQIYQQLHAKRSAERSRPKNS